MEVGTVLTLWIPAVTALVTAALSAVVLVSSKRIDVRSSVEQSHAETRVEAYEHVLTAADAMWYMTLKLSMIDMPDDPSELREFSERWYSDINVRMQYGMDQLQASSREYDTVEKVIVHLILVAEARIPDLVPQHYEQARDLVVKCQRHDRGLGRKLQLRGLKRWPAKLAALREAAKPPPTTVDLWMKKAEEHPDAAGVIIQDPNAIVEYLERHRRIQEDFEASLHSTASRLESWRKRGLWDQGLFLEGNPKYDVW